MDKRLMVEVQEDGDIRRQAEEAMTVADHARSIRVTDQATLKQAAGFIREANEAQKRVECFFAPMKDNAFAAHKAICAKEREVLAPILEAKKWLAGETGRYEQEQRAIAEAQRAEMERKQREEAQRLLDEAARLEQADDLFGADVALQLAASMESMPSPVAPEVKVDGVAFYTDYEVELVDEQAVPAYVGNIEIRRIDPGAIRRLAQMSKGSIKIPGVVIREIRRSKATGR
jgi:hypothetical protein